MAPRVAALLAAVVAATVAPASAAPAAAAAAHGHRAGNATIELYLLPHTHADVGWLETPENLARVNVSRILDGVVGNLGNDTKKRRRFVWDEMYFLQWWWENRATPQQQATFHTLVQEGRIEFVDNGWSQHDMVREGGPLCDFLFGFFVHISYIVITYLAPLAFVARPSLPRACSIHCLRSIKAG